VRAGLAGCPPAPPRTKRGSPSHGSPAFFIEVLADAQAADATEDARFGGDRRGNKLPEELERRQTGLQKIREAKQAAGA
jgi:hypothetical protein